MHCFFDHIGRSCRATLKFPLPSQGVHGGLATFGPSRTDTSGIEVSADDDDVGRDDVEVCLGPDVDTVPLLTGT